MMTYQTKEVTHQLLKKFKSLIHLILVIEQIPFQTIQNKEDNHFIADLSNQNKDLFNYIQFFISQLIKLQLQTFKNQFNTKQNN
ncbi:hypothetical protein TTHERM_00049180 (macronuclear) [Tetrahymena thermophila SB210]|uniref:Uncharacterized protein n=1 Tax=Tetrahymena thermophila (strain SB210) TaxID=312017 RepID=Q23D73_TETTS|nr:hypothetical protein TTHERM_00049180 [Tetrahymena thermophila SB210]EAR94349.2 hypothetical protein TTHERM_00049180 [Tetrahymena thermophila SB210]|eukprot:XP_001014813.2 hypothetical protein TTHERM_00049180 [Tetrahymena thermophila SB210]